MVRADAHPEVDNLQFSAYIEFNREQPLAVARRRVLQSNNCCGIIQGVFRLRLHLKPDVPAIDGRETNHPVPHREHDASPLCIRPGRKS
jgi:hypothetical protein